MNIGEGKAWVSKDSDSNDFGTVGKYEHQSVSEEQLCLKKYNDAQGARQTFGLNIQFSFRSKCMKNKIL